jgi:hypothetical protein
MLKKLLVTAAAAGVLIGLAPAPSEAAPAVGVAVFLGDAKVGPGTLRGGPGLCMPGLVPSAGACSAPSIPPALPIAPNSGFQFSAPSNVTPPAGPPIPGACIAAGVFNITTAPSANAAVDLSCSFHVGAINTGGLVTGVVGGTTGPTCGNSHGRSGDGAFNLTAPEVGSAGAFTIADVGWVTSAGGTIPAFGSIDGNQLVALSQARPLQSGACVLQPATTFTTVGVTAVLPIPAVVTFA